MYTIVAVILVTVQVINGQVIGNVYNAAAYNNAVAGNIVSEATIANTLAYNPAVNVAYANTVDYEPIATVPVGIPGINYGLGLGELSASRGPGLRVSSASPISPTGLTVESENIIMEGPVAVSGQLPFLGVVSMEGPLPAAGYGAVAYGCGNGNVGIVSEVPEAVGVANVPGLPGPYAPMQGRAVY